MSSIVIPEIGAFNIFFQDTENQLPKSKPMNDDSNGIIGKKLELWDRILMEIELKISQPSYETWFKSTSAVQLDQKHLCIVCNNDFQMDWIIENYKDTIIETLTEVTGEILNLEFYVEKK